MPGSESTCVFDINAEIEGKSRKEEILRKIKCNKKVQASGREEEMWGAEYNLERWRGYVLQTKNTTPHGLQQIIILDYNR